MDMKDYKDPKNWKFRSTDKEGFHEVVTPETSACKVTWVFRLNLKKGKSYVLHNAKLELNGAIIEGKAEIKHESGSSELESRDSFYLPGNEKLEIIALEDLFVFIGGGPYEGKGSYFTRKYDLSLPIGDIHQIHGKSPYQREVFMTIAQQDEGSRLICGITFGEEGKWTSWPPHQHSKDLEEVYCYFDIPEPKFALHLASRKPGVVEAVHPVSTGDCIAVPEGYHPTVGIPGSKSCYFWVMSALKPESRRYDLAVNDPNFG
jgi:5-deoxy-glucuronate isomerase